MNSTAHLSQVDGFLQQAQQQRYLARHDDGVAILEAARTQHPNLTPADLNLLTINQAELQLEGGWLHNRLTGKLAELDAVLESAWQDAQGRGDMAQMALANMARGRLHYFYLFEADARAIDTTENYLIDAHRGFLEVGNIAGQADALFFRGLLYQIFKPDHAQAMSLFQDALNLVEGKGLDVLKSYVVRHIGFLYLVAGELGLAHQNLAESLALRESAGFRAFVPMAQIALAEVLAQQGQTEKALEYLNHALSLAQEQPDNRQIYVLMAFGEFYEKSDPAQARQYYEQGLSTARELGSARSVATIEAKLNELQA